MESGGRRQTMDTVAVHGGERRPGLEGSLVFPIFQGTVYTVPPGTDYHDIGYIRLSSTPSQRYLHDKLAALEGAEAAVAAASGMAALSAALLSCLKAGDHLLASNDLYGGTRDLLTHHAADLGWSCTFVDGRPESWEAAVRGETRAFLLETISNPLMRVPRLREAVALARRRGLVTILDNTFASPVNLRPLDQGVDLVFHSATKYLNGHSDLVAGCVAGARARVEAVRRVLNHFGGSLDPHAGYLLARGIKTLALRVRQQNATGLALAAFLEAHPKVAGVNYPGLPSHPDHAHARELMSGFGGMLSLRVRGGAAAADRFLAALRVPYVAPSLGGVETLATRPALTSHAGWTAEERARLGIDDDLVRVSCGIEGADDLLEDFGRALDAA
jgi:cystathionine gamma-synthase/cystathionine gamma-lyase/cystathionine beta-lyase